MERRILLIPLNTSYVLNVMLSYKVVGAIMLGILYSYADSLLDSYSTFAEEALVQFLT